MNQPTTAGRPPGQQGQELLDTARGAFLEHGFEGTTMDMVASRAGVSKSSLYREHRSKDALYQAVVSDWTNRGRDAMRPALQQLVAVGDVERGLSDFCSLLLEAVLSSSVALMRRLVSSQADRFPDVAQHYWTSSWDANIEALADVLSELDAAGRLDVDDPRTAAEQLVWLTVGGPLNAQTLTGNHAMGADGRGSLANAAARTFLARYRM